jgi:hypothetical protein
MISSSRIFVHYYLYNININKNTINGILYTLFADLEVSGSQIWSLDFMHPTDKLLAFSDQATLVG